MIAAQLTGNAAGRFLPGGGATSTMVRVSMLREAGVDTGEAAAAFTTSTLLQLATCFALPVLALPAILGGAPIDHGLATAAYLGAGVFVLLLGAGAISSRPTAARVGRTRSAMAAEPDGATAATADGFAPSWSRRGTSSGRRSAASGGRRCSRRPEHGFDYLALLAALRAVGASRGRPSLVLLAYTAAEVLALIPLTPGGLGFVEAGLVGTLGLAGVTSAAALAATLLYRIVAFWLPLPAGGVAYLLFRRSLSRAESTPA